LRKQIDKRLEVNTLSKADALVTVSQPWAEKLSKLHNNKATYTITNGYDPEIENKPPVNLTVNFTITYTGLVYQGKQDPAGLFIALSDMLKNGVINPADVELRFYGAHTGWLDREIEQYGLSDIARQYGMISRDAALQKQRESQLLLLLDWNDSQEEGVLPGKVFEYLAARRPVLAVGESESSVIAELIKETGAGVHGTAAEDICKAIKTVYTEFKSAGKVSWHSDESKIEKYSQLEMARKFSEILDSLV
jgi:glycosyltransferase involved in cell wall biosynthesis